MHRIIFVEGVSGSGKSTITTEIQGFLDKKGIHTKKLSFPTDYLRQHIREARARENRDPILESYLFACDARHQYITEIASEFEPTVFISDRSYFSTCAYCQTEEQTIWNILALNQGNHQPNILLILDCPPELALERIIQRAKQGGKPISKFENLRDLTTFRERYQRLIGIVPSARIIDSSKSFSETLKVVEKHILEEVLNGGS